MTVEKLEEGKVYYVFDKDNSFSMIGRVTLDYDSLDSDSQCSRGRATFINTREQFATDEGWCYKTKYSREFRLATREEIYWLDKCIEANKYIDKPESFMSYTINHEIIAVKTFDNKFEIEKWVEPIIKYIDPMTIIRVTDNWGAVPVDHITMAQFTKLFHKI